VYARPSRNDFDIVRQIARVVPLHTVNKRLTVPSERATNLGPAAQQQGGLSFAPPALSERCHRGLARRRIAVGARSWWCLKASVHIQGVPAGAALGLKMRLTTTPSASTCVFTVGENRG
jgi:hypothetical protein